MPGGDASMTLLASAQNPEMRKLKESHPRSISFTTVTRGRDNYALYAALRTKPGRADSPPTSSMSCSDKIAKWAALGFQGALLSRVLEPIFINKIIIDTESVPEGLREAVRSDCERAFGLRVGSLIRKAPAVSFQAPPFGPPVACPTSVHECKKYPTLTQTTLTTFEHYRGLRGTLPCGISLCVVTKEAYHRFNDHYRVHGM